MEDARAHSTTPTAAGPDDDLVILVHGTYASRDEDHGTSWWQDGSETHRELQHLLPDDVRIAGSGEVFHWSGENNERARLKAAQDLLAYVLELEARECPYHLLGHSHGGSVIWHMLRQATIERRELKFLRSWTTVGTPFIHHKTRKGSNFLNVLNVLLAVILFDPAIRIIGKFFGGMFFPSLIQPSAEEFSYERASLWRRPVLTVLEWIGLSIKQTAGGWKIGAHEIVSSDSCYQFLLTTPKGWLVLFMALTVVYVYLQLGVFFLSPVLESLRLRAEKRLERKMYERYRGRWLGLWSPEDEAINGLRATLDLAVSFVAPMAPQERAFYSDRLSVLSGPYYWVVTPIYNWLVRPALDRLVRSLVIKTLQGNNRPAAEVVQVSPAPVIARGVGTMPALPDELNDRIVRAADASAQDIAPKLRKLIALPTVVSGLEAFGATLSGRELVHTSYFDHPEVLSLIAMHVAWAHGETNWAGYRGSADSGVVAWLRTAKRQVGVELPAPVPTARRVDAAHAQPTRPKVALKIFSDWQQDGGAAGGKSESDVARKNAVATARSASSLQP